jgi:hypothetical protein
MSNAAGSVPALEVLCPQCRLIPNAETLRCPDCKEDLAPLVRLRYAGRIDYNEALQLTLAGEDFAGLVLLRRAVVAEKGLRPAWELMAEVARRIGACDDLDAAVAALETLSAEAR